MSEQDCDVVLVDDDASTLQAFARQLRLLNFTVQSFDDPFEAFAYLKEGFGKCLVVDLSMPDMDGLELQQRVADRGTPLSAVFLSGAGSVNTATRAMKNGALDFLEKPVEIDTLREAVEEGLARWSEDIAASRKRAAALERYERLTEKERSVLKALTEGHANKEIARQLSITERTVKAHRASIREKLEVSTIAEMIMIWRLTHTGDSDNPGAASS